MVFEKIRKVIAEHIEVSENEIKIESTFAEDLEIDSLDIFEIVMELEELFEMEIPSEDLEGMTKIDDLVKYINSRM